MTKIQHPENNSDSVSKAYESSLEHVLHESKKQLVSIQKLLDATHDGINDAINTTALNTADETVKLKRSISRDLLDAAHHIKESGKELKDWLGFDMLLIKNELWRNFTEATDKTTLELIRLKESAANAEYHTGEIIGLGTLVCDACKSVLHFHKPGHIPPCGKCHGTQFHRQKN